METANKIKKAVGAYSVYLAAMSDKILTGRFTQNGKGLMDRGNKATKHSIADVLVYMAAAYGKTLTFEEVEMGLIVAANNGSKEGAESANKKSGPDLENLGKEYADRLHHLLDERSIGMEISNLIDRFDLHKGATVGYRTIEQAVGVALRGLGWERRRQMTDGVRAYRWYPPTEWSFNNVDAKPDEPVANEVETEAFDDVFDNIETFTSEEPEVVQAPRTRKGSGVKPDEELSARILDMGPNLTNGVTSFEIALECYDFDANSIEVPKSEQDMSHKVKLSIGATMKALGWKKKTKRIDGIAVSGWYTTSEVANDEVIVEPKAHETLTRKHTEQDIVEEGGAEIAESLPRLSEVGLEDDLPWPDMSGFSDDGDNGDEGDSGSEEVVYVKLINSDGTEDVVKRTILMKNAGVYLAPASGESNQRMLEWDAEEQIWFCRTSSNEE